MSTRDLYTQKDKSLIRELLLNEQSGKCALTGLPLDKSQSVLDHAHDNEMFVRGVISRQSNSLLGVIENGWKRYMQWWYNGTISDFLRQCAQYLEKKPDSRYRHDHWVRKSQTLFNTLSEGDKKAVLEALGTSQGGNSTERKRLFKKALNTRRFTFEQIKGLIQERKDT